MAPTKKSRTSSKGATRTPTKATRKASSKRSAAKRDSATVPKKAAAAAKKAVEPVTRAANAAKRTASKNTKAGPAASSNGRQPDAIRVLTDDHRQVEELFVRFEKTGDGAHKGRSDLVQRITEALSIHASIEEEIFYPAARRSVAAAGDEVLEALEEHHLVKLTLAELEAMDPGHERYGAKVAVLIENVRHHVKEEEGELFPAVRRALDPGQLRELGGELAAAKRTAPTRPHPEAPDTPPGNLVAQVLTAPLDAAANLNKAAARRVRSIVS
jgi:hemerythrin-like domain-containing protein